MKTSTTLLLTASSVAAFSVLPQSKKVSSTALNGLFDGVKDAFSAPATTQIDSERETPIDRWMGWSVASDNAQKEVGAGADAGRCMIWILDSFFTSAGTKCACFCFVTDFIDSMDEKNYVSVELTKPMGIVFEENDSEFGGIFVQSLKEDGVAAENGMLESGDQLIVVGSKAVSGLDFDEALGTILDSTDEKTKLTLFRGTAKQFYGPTGPSKEWLDSFCEKGGVAVAQ